MYYIFIFVTIILIIILASMNSRRKKIELKGLTLPQLEKHFVAAGEKKFRASQVFN